MEKTISLKDANELLRTSKWNEAIDAYRMLWSKWEHEPSLRELVLQNINFIIKNAPTEYFDEENLLKIKEFPLSDCAFLKADQKLKVDRALCSENFLRSGESRSSLSDALEKSFGIQRIYAVNLDRRPDRHIRLLREFTYQGVRISRVSGVDAKKSQETLDKYNQFFSRSLTNRCITSSHIPDKRIKAYREIASLGWFAYLLSQRKVFEDAIKNDYRRILILDDDVFFSSNAVEQLNRLGGKIPDDFKVFLLGASEYSNRNSEEFLNSIVPDMPGIYRPIAGKTCGSFAVVYDSSVFPDILKAIDEADGPFDNVALGYVYNKFAKNCFSFASAICIPDVGDSDIRPDKRAQSAHSEKMGWEFLRYSEYTKEFRISVLVDNVDALRHVHTLQHELPSEIFLNVYFVSEDGLRPVITGHHCAVVDLKPLPISALDEHQLLKIIEKYRVPHSDLIFNWSNSPVSEEKVLQLAAKAMELKNAESILSGNIEGVRYVFNAGVSPVKGRHSIIIPSFRVVNDIWPTVESALNQDSSDFEVVIVNDNPLNIKFSDELETKIRIFSQKSRFDVVPNKIKIINHRVNRNASAARNTGYFMSTGEFITFLDDDDTFDASRISGVDLALRDSPKDIGACYCGYRGKWNGEENMNRFPEGDLMERVLSLRYAEHYMCTNTITFKRSSLDRLGGLNESYRRHQDLELMARFFKYSKILAVKDFFVNNRPSTVPETFVADVKKLVDLKIQFLSDMKMLIVSKGDQFVDLVVDAHAKDIIKRDKSMTAETANVIKLFLKSVLR
ncbi:glycosyltransferase [Pantoea sp. 18069]|uniref:glycosyltransferase n=1 Tax=Pantoea sp. 18069 TaxID=2681415 RepID=UPI0013570A6E|nr:glycosyltransferase [Pantoea sp. 18069]